MDAGQEAQAVGRVSRMGQTRPTHVHRFVVRDSIEENLHGLGRARKSGAEAQAQARGGVHLTVRDVGLLLAPPQAVIQERDEVGV
ncbi:hypothetical protein H632_c393p1 [Helicosporidium sp. ATCC 50920]|nr:hypothetical protein H632_c393p1 [Helicosporidium sp. ATCC 50920]|eukprot:KDD76019.1 hypothetical protein H632_c393p1 [Helicosporidium sp. ATCC 50920]